MLTKPIFFINKFFTLILTIVTLFSSLSLVVASYEGKSSDDSITEFLNKFLSSQSIKTEALDSQTVATDATLQSTNQFPLSSRFYNPQKPFSIFVSCVYTDPNKPDSSKAVFGYSNRTGKTITLDQSNINAENKIWLNDPTKYPNFPFDISSTSLSKEKDTEKSKTKIIKSLLPGDYEKAFAVDFRDNHDDDDKYKSDRDNPSKEIIWKAAVNKKNEASKYSSPENLDGYLDQTRASLKYSPQCDLSGKSQYTEGFSTPTTPRSTIYPKEFNQQKETIPDPFSKVNLFVECSIVDPVYQIKNVNIKNSKSKNEDTDSKDFKTYSAYIGYRNESGSRIDLTSSTINVLSKNNITEESFNPPKSGDDKGRDKEENDFKKNLSQPQIVHSYFQLSAQNIQNLGILKYQEYRDSQDPNNKALYDDAVINKDIDYSNPKALQKLSGAIQYLYPGQDSQAMIVGAKVGQELVWKVQLKTTDSKGNYITFTKQIKINPKYDEECLKDNQIPANSYKKDDYDEDDHDDHENSKDKEENNSNSEKEDYKSSPLKDSDKSKNNSSKSSNDTQNSSNNSKNSSSTSTKSTSGGNSKKTSFIEKLLAFGSVDVYAQTQQTLGDLNLSAYCDSKHGSQSSPVASGGVDSWKCGDVSIDTNDVCRWQYNRSDAQSMTTNPGDPYSWICFIENSTISQILGGLDLGGYCSNKYGSNAETLNNNSAYSWVCAQAKIDLNDACVFQYGSSASAFTDNPSDPYSLKCVTGGGNVTSPGGGSGGGGTVELPVDDDIEAADENLDEVATAYYSEQTAEINLPPTGEFISKLIKEVSDQTQTQLNEATKIPAFNECLSMGLNCASKIAQSQFNQAKLVAYFISGALQGAGQAIADLAKLIFDLATKFKDTITSLITAIGQLFEHPDLFGQIFIDYLQDYSTKDIYGKYELLGKAIGQFIPDIIFAVLTGGSSAAANVGAQVSKVVAETISKVKTLAKVINIAQRFIGRALYLGSELTINIVKVGEKIGMKGLEVLEKLKSLARSPFDRLMEILPNWIKEVTGKLRNLFSNCSNPCMIKVNKVNGAKGERYIQSLIGGINSPKKGFSYIFEGRRKLRYPDIREEILDAAGNVIGIKKATEVKVGYTILTDRIREQIIRDGELVRRGLYNSAEWQFVKSPETGMYGASTDVKNLLRENQIPFSEYDVDISTF